MLNFAVTDGCSVVCSRYISSRTLEAASLYYSSGTRFGSFQPGHYKMVKADKREDIVLIASEPLTFEKADWLKIPTNTVVVVTARMNVLMYPVMDEFQNCRSAAGETVARAEEHPTAVLAVLKGDGRGEDGARKPLAEREVVFVEDKRPPLSLINIRPSGGGKNEITGATPALSFESLQDAHGSGSSSDSSSPTMSSASLLSSSTSSMSTVSSLFDDQMMMMAVDEDAVVDEHSARHLRPNSKRKYPYSVGPAKTASAKTTAYGAVGDDCGMNGSDDEIEEDFKIFSQRRHRPSSFSFE